MIPREQAAVFLGFLGLDDLRINTYFMQGQNVVEGCNIPTDLLLLRIVLIRTPTARVSQFLQLLGPGKQASPANNKPFQRGWGHGSHDPTVAIPAGNFLGQ